MPLIEPENKNKPRKISLCLSHEAFDELSQYCQFLDSSCDHVIGALIQNLIPRDRDYQAWKTEARNHSGLPATEHVKTETRGRKKLTGANGSPHPHSAAREPLGVRDSATDTDRWEAGAAVPNNQPSQGEHKR